MIDHSCRLVPSGQWGRLWESEENMNLVKICTALIASTWLLAGVASAQNPAILLREDDTLGPVGHTIGGFGESQTNNVGGFAVDVVTDNGTSFLEHFWGFPMAGGTGAILQSSNVTVGNFLITAYEPYFGYADNGSLATSPSLTNTTTMTTGIDSCWVDLTPVLNEGDNPITEPQLVNRSNSRPAMIQTTGEPVWIGRLNDMGGTDVGSRLYRGAGHTVVLRDGVPAPAPLLTNISLNGIGSDFRFSAAGTHYIAEIETNLPIAVNNFMVIDGAIATTCTGTLIGEGELIPVESGGLPGEVWDNFDTLGINENGDFMIVGDTFASSPNDEFVSLNGTIVLREGDVIMDLAGGMHILAGSIDYACMNEQGDILVAWNNDLTDEVLILNGVVILAQGDEVDWDNDGVLDPGFTLDCIRGTTSGGISARSGGMVTVYAQVEVNNPLVMGKREGLLAMELVPPPALSPACVFEFADLCNGNGDQLGCGVCPCGNYAPSGTIGGCVNRSGYATRLYASGDTSTSLPTGPGTTTDLRFHLDGAPPLTFGVLVSGDAVAPTGPMNFCTPLNSGIPGIDRDGLRCAVMNTFRHGGRSANAMGEVNDASGPSRVWGGEAQPHGGIFTQGGFTAGQTRYFQVTHREDPAFVCGFSLNTSQAVEVTFTP